MIAFLDSSTTNLNFMDIDNLFNELAGPSQKKSVKKQTPDDLLAELTQQSRQPAARPATQQQSRSRHTGANIANLNNMFAEPETAKPAAPQQHRPVTAAPNQRQPQKKMQQEDIETDSFWSTPSSKKSVQKQQTGLIPLKDCILNGSTFDDFFKLLFADKRVKAISDNWYQGLRCNSMDEPVNMNQPATWAIHQNAGGPCGFLAVIQSRAVKYLFMKQKLLVDIPGKQYRSAILSSLVEIFLKLNEERYQVVLPVKIDDETIPVDRIVQEMDLFGVKFLQSKDELIELFGSQKFQNYCFQNTSSFVPAMVFSVVLTRSVNKILDQDFDKDSQIATGSLFSNYNNCSQELVNLIITGKATPNIHDGKLDLGGMILNGIEERQDIGLLTIFEHHEYLNVGSCLKDPMFNVWVVFNEAHFTCLFTLNKSFNSDGVVDFVYSDQLDDQKKLCRISVEINQEEYKKNKQPESYVEAIIQTLVPSISFNWNGHEKYL